MRNMKHQLLLLSVLILLAFSPVVSAGEQVNITLITYSDGAVIDYAKEATPYNESINVTYHSTKYNLSEIDLSNQDVIFTYMLWHPKYDEFADEMEKAKANGTVLINIASYINSSILDSMYDYDFSGGQPYESFDEQYFFNMGMQEEFLKENAENFLVYLAKNYSSKTTLTSSWTYAEPILLPQGIYHPDTDAYWFDTPEDYFEWYQNDSNGEHFIYDPTKPTVGIWFHKSDYKDGNTEVVDALIRDLESKDCNVIAGFDTFHDISGFYCDGNGTPLVQCMISLKSFGLDVGEEEGYGHDELTNLNVPVLKGMVADPSSGDPADANRGISNQEATRKTVLPNIDGMFEYIVLGHQEKISWGVYEYVPNAAQIDWMANRSIEWAELKRSDDGDKKVAVIYYNYPPGKDSIGASYLDSMASIMNLLDKMNESGYYLTDTPENTTDLLDKVKKQGINVGSWAPGVLDEMVENRTEWGVQLIPVETYHQWFEQEIPENLRTQVINEWGEPWSEDFTEDKMFMIWENESGRYIVIPTVQCGNVWLMPQPARGMTQNDNVLYHSSLVPPPHQYIAFYLWLNDDWDADAVIHLGTHGTHEWLPGLAYGMNRTADWAPLLLQDMPNIYPYIVANVGEGLTAEYRGNALIIDHLTPTLERGGLHAEMADLSSNIQTYYDPGMADEVRVGYRLTIINQMVDLNLHEDLNVDEATLELYRTNDTQFQLFLKNVLHEYLEEISEENIPYGFHVLGEVPPMNASGPEGDQMSAMVRAMLGSSFQNNVAGAFYYNEAEYPMGIPLNDTKIDLMVWEVVTNGNSPANAQDLVYGLNNSSITSDLERGILYKDNLIASADELDRVISALDAGFVPAGPGRDPIQNPDSIPTGRNFYGVDSRLYPSEVTWELGSLLAQSMLEDYYEKHGTYPEKVSFSRFGVEFIRDHGTLEAEVLYLLGVKPVWDETSKQVVSLELMNESELLPNYDPSMPGRPRIDIVYTTAGMRDAFPDKIKMIDEAVRMANEAPAGNYTNYVNQSTQNVKQALIDAGYDEETASQLSTMRCFAVRDGTYEIGVANAIGASGTWDNEATIAELYLNKMGYGYGTDIWGYQSSDLLTENLRNVGASVHSDSSNLYDTLDNDDVFQYFGGLNLATRHVSGETPEMYISDTRNPAESGMVTMKEYLDKNLRSRYYNQEWIEGMQASGYAGGKMFSEFVENLWGWEVTNPELVDDSDWEMVYEKFINDPEMQEWFQENNPDAYQSMTGRMLEVIRKDYMDDPSDEMFQNLMKEYVESVVENGVSCCHHTCGNPMLNSYVVEGLMSVPGVVSEETLAEFIKKIEEANQAKLEMPSESSPKSSSSSGGVGSAQIVNSSTTGSGSNQTAISDGGYGDSLDDPSLDSSTSNEGYVEGYEMTKENVRKDESGGSSFSGSDVFGIVFVLAVVGVMYLGFRRRRL
ncbi:cobaltochelatase subunit CobN [Methanococcoides orientis]|uniref:cobaltochelatase subunit CobN n=1 Tax=Methanococcoides orientis TaxID=2822137 RepID=UPI001E58D417|nr:cobaltochelatase subunit CobN [Methanococcoides orientis]UGV40790.1 cobaltochelatase subunit CobN [Methanococcoides orientis]